MLCNYCIQFRLLCVLAKAIYLSIILRITYKKCKMAIKLLTVYIYIIIIIYFVRFHYRKTFVKVNIRISQYISIYRSMFNIYFVQMKRLGNVPVNSELENRQLLNYSTGLQTRKCSTCQRWRIALYARTG